MLFFLLSLVCASRFSVVCAADLADYQERVHASLMALDTLAAIDEEESEEAYAAKVSGAIGEVRRLLPARERVEWREEAFEVDNRWLHESLNSYERMPVEETEKRRDLLARTTERLGAIGNRLDEINPLIRRSTQQQSAKQNAQNTRAARERLEAILRREGYARDDAAQKKSALARYAERFREWMRNVVPKPEPIRANKNPRVSFAAEIFVYGLSLAVIVFVLWRYGGRLWPRGRLGGLKLKRPRVVLGEHLAADETPADLFDAAEQLARSGNLRGAIRKAYIALLVELGERKILRLAQHRTNRDYLQALRRERAPLYKEIEPLTNNFERHWYGRAAAEASDWTDFRTRCRKAIEASSQ